MRDFQYQMNRVVQTFVDQITEIAHHAAIETLHSAFGRRRDPPTSVAGVRPVGRPRGRRGEKRTSEALEQVSKSLVAFVRQNPGLRVEQINRKLGTTTKDLALPIRRLIATGLLNAKGKRRSTTYHPAVIVH